MATMHVDYDSPEMPSLEESVKNLRQNIGKGLMNEDCIQKEVVCYIHDEYGYSLVEHID